MRSHIKEKDIERMIQIERSMGIDGKEKRSIAGTSGPLKPSLHETQLSQG